MTTVSGGPYITYNGDNNILAKQFASGRYSTTTDVTRGKRKGIKYIIKVL